MHITSPTETSCRAQNHQRQFARTHPHSWWCALSNAKQSRAEALTTVNGVVVRSAHRLQNLNKVKSPTHRAFMLAQEIAAHYRITPLDYLLSIVNNEHAPMDFRIDCAKAAAPYVHRKMPAAVDMNVNQKSVSVALSQQDLRKLDERELETLITAFEKIETLQVEVPEIAPTNFLQATSVPAEEDADA